jgi:glyoxylase-like metal-dependent hydrolase (beta-lactamase superfamily II)
VSRPVERVESGGGGRIYRLPLEVLPGFWGYAHYVVADGMRALVDVGSGIGESNDQLAAGLAAVAEDFGEPADWAHLTHVLISHGHIDHFGGLPFVMQQTAAPVYVHEMDLRTLTRYEERLAIVGHRLREYLIEAGLSAQRRAELMDLYMLNKQLFQSVDVRHTYLHDAPLGPLGVYHVPGHCPGQVVFTLDDVMLTSDHVLPVTSPHQAPERLTLSTGVGHYLASLRKLAPLAANVRLAIGGHEGPIADLGARLEELQGFHRQRMRLILEAMTEPCTIGELSHTLFPHATGYHALLAVEETGAHIEYLEQRGFVGLDNAHDLEVEERCALHYVRLQERPIETLDAAGLNSEIIAAPQSKGGTVDVQL